MAESLGDGGVLFRLENPTPANDGNKKSKCGPPGSIKHACRLIAFCGDILDKDWLDCLQVKGLRFPIINLHSRATSATLIRSCMDPFCLSTRNSRCDSPLRVALLRWLNIV